MDQVANRLPVDFAWPTVGRSGMAPIDSIVPDPEQPRKHFDEAELDALAATMKADNEGEQREIVTVSELTSAQRELYPTARYMLKSGERRWRAGKRAGLSMLEIRVKKYISRAKEKLDMYMLNEGRVGLSDIENAHYLAELMREFNLKTQEELSALVGKDTFYISQHLALLKLIPEVQALMAPSIPERSRLRMGSAIIFSRLTEEVQRDFVGRMPHGERVSTRQQVDWLKAEIAKGGINVATRTLSPKTLRRMLGYFADQLEKRVGDIAKFEEFNRLFDNAGHEQVFGLLGKIKDAQAELGDLVTKIEELSKPFDPKSQHTVQQSAPKPISAKPDVKAQAQAFVERRNKLASTAKVAEETVPIIREGPKLFPIKPASTAAHLRKGGEKTITYFNESRKVTDKVSQEKYLELWDTNSLGFQVDKKDRPAWMPTREAALEDWDKYCD